MDQLEGRISWIARIEASGEEIIQIQQKEGVF